MKIIGREQEIVLLKQLYESKEPEFVTVYGRRRVGKTYLINEHFKEQFAFSVTALADKSKSAQLKNFHSSLRKYGYKEEVCAGDWYDSFERLIFLLENSRVKGKKVIFLDELPWFDTKRSGFLSALEHFWNGWAASRPDVLLIVCGSATSWMMNRLILNKRGLHNRVTKKLHLSPFTLTEAEQYLIYHDIFWERHDVAIAYMVLGGIPFYLKQLSPQLSCAQNIDYLCFQKDAPMRNEFNILFASLFNNPDKHLKLLEALSRSKCGLTRDQLLGAAGFSSGGATTTLLTELEQCGFIERYNDFLGSRGRYIFQLTDFFTLFYLKQMKGNRQLTDGYWLKSIGSGTYNNWVGQTFEKLCLVHVNKIKQALGISGIIATPFAWRSTQASPGAQIDLLIDRKDNCINICECKFTQDPFIVEKEYATKLRNKMAAFRIETKTRKTLFLTLIASSGMKQNKYSGMMQNVILLDDLF
ncbi:MAG: ATP-binding protein [Coriobacteriales bacterium]|jgi:AAA+ ATPase superfamily predicted ATPase|nr:ATP-binding protein [Coriobacteriales bacterium]